MCLIFNISITIPSINVIILYFIYQAIIHSLQHFSKIIKIVLSIVFSVKLRYNFIGVCIFLFDKSQTNSEYESKDDNSSRILKYC